MKTGGLKTVLLILTLALCSVGLAAQDHVNIDGVVNTLKQRITLQGYAQLGYSYNNQGGEEENTFEVKRLIFMATGQITSRWSCFMMYSFASSPKLLELYGDYKVASWLTVRFGQFKPAFTIECPVSPCYVELINCYSMATNYLAGVDGSDPLHGSNSARDIGIAALGEAFGGRLAYQFSLMNGQGINQKDKNNAKDFVGLLSVKPVDALLLSVSGRVGKGYAAATSDVNPDIAEGQTYTRNRLAAGAKLTTRHFNLRAEYLQGKDGHVDSRGCYAVTSIHLSKRLDLVAAVDYFDPDTDGSLLRQTNYVGGLQYWFYPKCRLQAQYTRCCCKAEADYNLVQAQLQVRF